MTPIHFPPASASASREVYCVTISQQKRLQAQFPSVNVPVAVALLAAHYYDMPPECIPATATKYWKAVVDHLKSMVSV